MTDTDAAGFDALLAEHADLERQLADPNLHADPGGGPQGGPTVRAGLADRRDLSQAGDRPRRPRAAKELAADDESFAAEIPELESTVEELDTQLTDLLAPA